ncbi:MAG: hypothetical protein SAK29_35330 [Scytonema sp. PMC 1069.18]|nr:hypothetical protein [Scytonema sp. PMC 1069.18]MEC4885611.1 hypothetical protein [Scytonema sp. PMC 1070.18]
MDNEEFIRQVKAGEVLPTNHTVILRDEQQGGELYMMDFEAWQIHLHYDAVGELIKGHLKGIGNQQDIRDQIYQVDADLILERMRLLAQDGTIKMRHDS